MKVLVACEYSGIVRDAFSRKGHDAWSCDLLPTESELTIEEGKHIQDDAIKVAYGYEWDLMIAHPPCTYLSYAGYWKYNNTEEQKEAVEFFKKLYHAPIERICIENPRGIMSKWKRENQLIEPYLFGDPWRKRTLIWLRGLPCLLFGPINPEGMLPKKVYTRKTGSKKGGKYGVYYMDSVRSGKDRSRFWPGIAKAMANQWG